ncbi:MAG: hypothetical protein ACRET0_06575 [Steroidobacteraceae bacterium]
MLLSGLLWHGPPHGLIERLREGSLALLSSPALLAEIQALAEVIAPVRLPVPVCRDPDDDEFSRWPSPLRPI